MILLLNPQTLPRPLRRIQSSRAFENGLSHTMTFLNSGMRCQVLASTLDNLHQLLLLLEISHAA